MSKVPTVEHASLKIKGESVEQLPAGRVSELTAGICGEVFARCLARRRDQRCTVQAWAAELLGQAGEVFFGCDEEDCTGPEAAALKLHKAIAMEEPEPYETEELATADL